MPLNSESTPPPKIGKIGPYTVFITPPPTPAAAAPTVSVASPPSPPSPPVFQSPVKPPSPAPAPVQAPPSQFYKSSGKTHSSFGFFWDAVAKVQNAHASLDEHVAYWFGLNQSKYQWALNDYYESNDPSVKKSEVLSGKAQDV